MNLPSSPRQAPPFDDIDLPAPATSPAWLALASWLHGGPCPTGAPGTSSAPRALRVLELGARAGANLLPLAFYDRAGQYVGLDADPAKVDEARAAAAELGLSNVRFEHASLAERPGALGGPFGIILARDVFADMSDEAGAALLASCRSVLAPDGLLYVDYPVLPGAGQEALVRVLLQAADRVGDDKAARAARARAAAAGFRGLLATPEHPYPNLLAAELGRAAEATAPEVWSRYLTRSPRAFFHRDVAARAARAGLRYVCDADFQHAQAFAPDALRAALVEQGLRDAALEQALDIFCYRRERASVFCPAEAPEAPAPGPAALDHLLIAASFSAANDPPRLHPGVEEAFTDPDGQRIGSRDPLFKAALLVLGEAWPRPLPFAEVVGRAVEILRRHGAEGDPGDEQLAGLASDLWMLHRRGLVALHAREPALPVSPRRRPHALARLEARRGTAVTTPMHTRLSLQGFDAAVVRHSAAGMSDEALVGALMASLVAGEVPVEIGGARITDPLLLEPMTRGMLQRALVTLGRWGLLEGE